MEHADYDGTVAAGCVCAEHMEEDYSSPERPSRAKAREGLLRNSASRMKRWLTLRGWKLSRKGNPYISKNAYHIVIFPTGAQYSFKIERKNSNKPYFYRRSFDSIDAAKLSSFDAMSFLEAS